MCLNFVENARCHVDGRRCILGARGAFAKNEDHECRLHGDFDVWAIGRRVLVTDLGFPPEEPAQSLALRVNETVAMTIALEKSARAGMSLTTSQRRCIQCGALYWISEHVRVSGMIQNGYTSFCPKCFGHVDSLGVERRLTEQRYWCG
jgi:hypothetical protein